LWGLIKMRKITRGQEEMVGFVLIIILTAIIFVILLGISLRKPAASIERENAEIESFSQAMLGVTSSCVLGYEGNYQSLRDIVLACNDGKVCLSGENSCVILKKEVTGLMDAGWKVSEDRVIKGYSANIQLGSGEVINVTKGNQTKNSIGSVQDLAEKNSVQIKIYY
jgi:hypothetical protein